MPGLGTVDTKRPLKSLGRSCPVAGEDPEVADALPELGGEIGLVGAEALISSRRRWAETLGSTPSS